MGVGNITGNSHSKKAFVLTAKLCRSLILKISDCRKIFQE
jgi:hypothetical protein